MKRAILALDIQVEHKTPEMIVNTVRQLSEKVPTICTVLQEGEKQPLFRNWIDFHVPEEDTALISTKYVYGRDGYSLPPIVLKMLQKNDIEEVIVTGAHTEAFLLSAGFELFDAGVKPILAAPLCLSGQYHQHSVTMNIWENSIGPVVETVAELGLGVS